MHQATIAVTALTVLGIFFLPSWGLNVRFEDCPYVASIIYNTMFEGVGSVISEHYILTSAEIASLPDVQQLMLIRVGSSKPDIGGSMHRVKEIKFPESYTTEARDKNIAVIVLSEPITNERVKPVKLVNDTHPDPPEKLGHMIGWNWIQDPNEKVPELKFQRFEGLVKSRADCNADLHTTLPADQFCVNTRQPTKDREHRERCQSNLTGAPMINAENYQFGVFISKPANVSCYETPAVYTSLYQHQMWLLEFQEPPPPEEPEPDYTIYIVILVVLTAVLVILGLLYTFRDKIKKIFKK